MSNPLTECILKNDIEIGFAVPLSSEPLGLELDRSLIILNVILICKEFFFSIQSPSI